MKKLPSKSSEALREMARAFPVVVSVHRAEDDGYWVEAPQLGGCFSAGDTVAEALHNFKLAIFDYFDIPQKLQKPETLELHAIEVPEPKSIKSPATATFFPTQAFITA